MKFSIIIPVYNAQAFLRRCLNSILACSLDDGEILIIDDNSTDKSWEIINEYVNKYPQLCKGLKTSQNSGVSAARNIGLNIAQGEYIIFIDSDDYWVNNKIVELIEAASDETLVIGGFEVTHLQKQLMVQQANCYNVITIDNFLDRLIQPETQYYYGVLWNKVFSAKIIQLYNLRFREDIDLCEEWSFILGYIQYTKKIILMPSYFYSHTQDNDESLSKKKRSRGENWRIMSSVYDNICMVYKKLSTYKLNATKINTFLLNPIIKELIEQTEAKEPITVTKAFTSQPVVQKVVNDCQHSDLFEKLVSTLIRKQKCMILRLFLNIKCFYSAPYNMKKRYYKVVDQNKLKNFD